MVLKCLGCAIMHIADAAVLVDEARKFERLGDRRMADLHLAKALGQLREGEEHVPQEKLATRLREIRKQIESSIASGQPIPNVSEELHREVATMIEILRGRPELCPTCRVEVGPTHVASHRV